MEFLGQHAIGKFLQDDALKLSSDAKKAKKNDPEVIDGTLGAFYYDDGTFCTHKIVKEVFNKLGDQDIYSYSTVDGGKDFQNAAFNHMFRAYRSYIEQTMAIKCIATPGGTGALVSSCFSTLDPGQTLLVPTPCWGPYFGIAKHRNINTETFFMFDNDKFNIKEFKEKANKIIEKQNKLVFFFLLRCYNYNR